LGEKRQFFLGVFFFGEEVGYVITFLANKNPCYIPAMPRLGIQIFY